MASMGLCHTNTAVLQLTVDKGRDGLTEDAAQGILWQLTVLQQQSWGERDAADC